MRIFHIANFDLSSKSLAFYSSERKISNGFIKSGHLVHEFSYNDLLRLHSVVKSRNYFRGKGLGVLSNAIEAFDPEIILIGHVNLPPNWLKKVKQTCPNAQVIAWYVDPPERRRMRRYEELADSIDALFLTSGGSLLKELKAHFKHIPLIGFFPNPVDKTIDTIASFDEQMHEYDVLFVGGDRKYKGRAQFIDGVRNKTLNMRWAIAGCLGNPPVTGRKYFDLLKKTRFGINISKFQPNTFDIYSSDRIAQLTGNGLLTFNQYFPLIEKLFGPDEHVVFRDEGDLIEKLDYFRDNPLEAMEIARRGHKKVHAAYQNTRVSQYMLEALDGCYSSDYEWADQLVS